MPNYYMFLLFLLFVVLSILSFRDAKSFQMKEGMDSRETASKIYYNYDIIHKTLEEYNARFKYLAI